MITLTKFSEYNEFNLLKQIAVKASKAVTTKSGTYVRKAHFRNIKLKQAVENLADQTLRTGEIPSRKELSKVGVELAKDFVRNPVRTIKEGTEREKLVKTLIEANTKTKLPTNSELIKEGFKKGSVAIAKNTELQVNTAGFITGKVGASIAGLPGELAGDLLGATVARKTITDISVTKKALQIARTDETFRSLNTIDKARKVRSISLSELKKLAEEGKLTDDIVGDTSGWGIGSTVANTVPLPIPFKGAIAANYAVPEVVKGSKEIAKGAKVLPTTKSVIKGIATRAKRSIDAGNKREQELRNKLNNKLKTILGKNNE